MRYATVLLPFTFCVNDGVGTVPPREIIGYCFDEEAGDRLFCIFWFTFHWRMRMALTPDQYFKFAYVFFFTVDVYFASLVIVYPYCSIIIIVNLS